MNKKKKILLTIFSILIPFIIMTIYILISRYFYYKKGNIDSTQFDHIFTFFSIAMGIIAILFLPIKKKSKIILIICNIPIYIWFYIFYGLLFICTFYGDCL